MTEQQLAALSAAKGLVGSPKDVDKLSAMFGAENARWAFSQWRARKQGSNKFSLSGEMLFSSEALEQATSEKLAAYHASRFPTGARVGDLTAGIGSDLIALASRGEAVGYEVDSERREYALHNLALHGYAETEVRLEDCLTATWDFEYAFADPARRVGGKRTLDPDQFGPPLEPLASKMAELKLGGIKVSPLLPDSLLCSLGKGLEFVSMGGECREALIWMGAEANTGRRAVRADTGAVIEANGSLVEIDEPLQYLFEADPAAIRAHALPSLGLRGLGTSNGYLTGHQPVKSEWLKTYRVLYFGRSDFKETKKALQSLDSATPDIKSRGPSLDVAKLRKEFLLNGTRALSVVIYPVSKSIRHLIVERIGFETGN